MNARFLLGPAGSGKTHHCLAEIRRELSENADGPLLVLLAPKQATFQVERQLLAEPGLSGYTRLEVLSFERLAGRVFDWLGMATPEVLADEGRVMVLRALVLRHRTELEVFGASARFPGFAQQLSLLLRELEQHRATSGVLEATSGQRFKGKLGAKLRDLSRLQRLYEQWLGRRDLEDADHLLSLAAVALRRNPPATGLRLGGIWMDGFAQMTPGERELLLALLPFADRATLAFCLDDEPAEDQAWYHPWALVGETFVRCRDAVTGIPGAKVEVKRLGRASVATRFESSPELAHLERHWNDLIPYPDSSGVDPGSVRVAVCPNPDAEAVYVAREILRSVRNEGWRYRDVAVLVRRLESYHNPLRRAFSRYGIPYFLDRREAVAHHPLAELTRAALRTVWFGWQHDDWFSALKSGLVATEEEGELDRLENEALAAGWVGENWRGSRRPAKGTDETTRRWLDGVINRLVAPFERLERRLAVPATGSGVGPTGAELAGALTDLWDGLGIRRRLESWSMGAPGDQVHATVWEQMVEWLGNVALAFQNERLKSSEWIQVVESGLAGLTVGVVPPVLDQVLIGAVDRSRNPDLRMAFVLGMNEGHFPAAPDSGGLLTPSEREELEQAGCGLGPGLRPRLGLERFYGYIACTRARERLILTLAQRDSEGRTLNPSCFIRQLEQLFPKLKPSEFVQPRDWQEFEHPSEMVAPLLRARSANTGVGLADEGLALVSKWDVFRGSLEPFEHLRAGSEPGALPVSLVGKLYGEVLSTSVSRIEQFAMCPFRFFVHSGLRAGERVRYELDTRQQGSFQHEVLARFHEAVQRSGRRWRDLTVEEARGLMACTAETVMKEFEGGMLMATARNRFVARGYIEALQQFIGVVVGWMEQYRFDPARVELGFGLPGSGLPAWNLALGNGHALALRGRIDRVDIGSDSPGEGLTPCVVIDYKSRARQLDRVLAEHGIEMQLPAYLNVVRRLPGVRKELGVGALKPAGVFYVNLRGETRTRPIRDEALANLDDSRRVAYRHRGLFNLEQLRSLDNRSGVTTGDQIDYQLTRGGRLSKRSLSGMPAGEFEDFLDRQEALLIHFGKRIYLGEVAVDPYRKGQNTACKSCTYASICRIDPWVHVYRELKVPENEDGQEAEEEEA